MTTMFCYKAMLRQCTSSPLFDPSARGGSSDDLIQVAQDVIRQRRNLVPAQELGDLHPARATTLAWPAGESPSSAPRSGRRISRTVCISDRNMPPLDGFRHHVEGQRLRGDFVAPTMCLMRPIISSSITAASKQPVSPLSRFPMPDRISVPARAGIMAFAMR